MPTEEEAEESYQETLYDQACLLLEKMTDETRARFYDQHEDVVVLTSTAQEIAGSLIYMEDQEKLRKIARFVNDHLKHPDRTETERSIALGTMGISGINGPLGKREALARLKEPPQDHSWLVEATTKDGQRWRNGVRLRTKEEAELYIESHVQPQLEKAGFVSAKVIQDGVPPNCNLYRKTRGGRVVILGFEDGQCHSLHWRDEAGEVVEAPPPSHRLP